MGEVRLLALLLVLMACVTGAFAINNVVTSRKIGATGQPADRDLNTYAFTAHNVQLASSFAGSSTTDRPGTTRVTMQLTAEQLQPAAPVTTAARTGLVHNVLDAWAFFKNYALQSSLVSAVNSQAESGSTLYPKACVAAAASSLLTNPKTSSTAAPLSVARFAAAVEAAGQRELWTHTAPTNMLLLIPGQAVGAVADIMSAELSESGPTVVTLTLDIVHSPRMISEYEEHPKQTLDAQAHYHYFTPAGVSVDAARFLGVVRAAGNQLPALHMFAKGDQCTSLRDIGTPCEGTSKSFKELACAGFCQLEVQAGKQDVECQCVPGCVVAKDQVGNDCTFPDNAQNVACETGECTNVESKDYEDGINTCIEDDPCPCTAEQTCRPAVGLCDVAETCDASGTCPDDKVIPAGTLCRKSSKTCELDSTCDGKSGDCHYVYRPNGAECLYDEMEDSLFWPFAEVASYDDRTREQYERDPHGERWPACHGRCSGGKCVFDKTKRGCCYNRGGRHGYIESAGLTDTDSYAPANLMCWDGDDSY